ncbi:MAG: hypothetical protein K9M75_09030 [Phycisphaerae bacterium]|nr:hypothetical protein [Phycisphaerae bacterium]
MSKPKKFIKSKLYSKYPLLNYSLSDYNQDAYDNIAVPLWKKEKELLTTNQSFLPSIERYLQSGLHDSEMISFAYNYQTVTINFDEVQCSDFYWAFTDIMKLPGIIPVFPVSLIFHNIRNFTAYKVNRNNKLLPVSKNKWLPRIYDYQTEHVIDVTPSSISIAIVVSSKYKYNCYIVLEIEAERLEIKENQREVFKEHLGEKHLPIIDKFIKEMDNGKRFYDCSVAEAFIKKNL